MLARLLLLCVLAGLSAGSRAAPPEPAPAATAPRIGVITMQPGEIFFERFGHDAIVVADPATGASTSYNFGFFDMGEPGFMPRFALGDMRYYLVSLPLEEDLAYYREVGRGVDLQWLDLPPDRARALAAALAEEARPENARYDYEYFTNNCSTKVRDVINQAMGGALKSQLVGRSRGNTFRSEAVRLASPATWMWLGFDIGLGPYADTPMSRWEEAYVPMRLADSLREAQNNEGRPLVHEELRILPHSIAPEPEERARSWLPWLGAGVLLAVLILAAARRAPRLLGGFGLLLWTVCGLAGLVMVFLWGFTEHQAAWANRNLLLFNPLCVLLVPAGITLLRRRPLGAWQSWLLVAIAAGAAVAWFLHWLPLPLQYNQSWVALLLPVHAALAYVFAPRGSLSA